MLPTMALSATVPAQYGRIRTWDGTERKERFGNVPERAHSTLRTGSLGVQSSVRHRPYWEPWRSELCTPSGALGSLGVQSLSRHRGLLGALAVKAFHAAESPKHVGSATWSSWEPWRRNCVLHWVVLGREPWRQSCVRHCAVVGPEGSHHRPY